MPKREFFQGLNFSTLIEKKNKREMKLIIMGCMAQTSRDTLKNLGVDKIFDVYNEINILDYIKD